ncbi:MAG: hypothetical protein R3Y59_09810, partial [bacterium]
NGRFLIGIFLICHLVVFFNFLVVSVLYTIICFDMLKKGGGGVVLSKKNINFGAFIYAIISQRISAYNWRRKL